MKTDLETARITFIEGISRIALFWGFPKALGSIYGAIYLSPDPVTLDALVDQVGVSKGAASTNVRTLQRLGMIEKKIVLGDRKDYYVAETDFWKIIRGILREREKTEFSIALRSVSESLAMTGKITGKEDPEGAVSFTRERMEAMKRFFDSLDSLVATILALDSMRLSTLGKMLGRQTREKPRD